MPWVCAPSTSKGKGWSRTGSFALSSASIPTWGPLPWVTMISLPSQMRANCATASTTWCCWISAPGRSPRWSRAFPPRAATTRISGLHQRGDHDRLDRVQAVLRLVEDDRRLRLEDLVGDFEGAEIVALVEFGAHVSRGVVQRRQAVHEPHLGIVRGHQEVVVHLVGAE